ncbi:hypothetical protein LEP1GSC111_4424 [Leptospira interrogans str. UT126]|nr:hypothetical protein LEP1GSC080_0407 [Leptospira interrogans str. FPW2026]EMJ48961.1 hypothetical protein LEP1GSC111_4424 [Leptospira interrogans str. UT126]
MEVKFFKIVQTINKKPIRILNYKFSIYSLVFRAKQKSILNLKIDS